MLFRILPVGRGGGGQDRETIRHKTNAEVHATVEFMADLSTSSAPLRSRHHPTRLYRNRSALANETWSAKKKWITAPKEGRELDAVDHLRLRARRTCAESPLGIPFLMARITVEDCLQESSNRFELVMLAVKRARQLLKGAKPLIGSDNREVVIALREIAARKVRRASPKT